MEFTGFLYPLFLEDRSKENACTWNDVVAIVKYGGQNMYIASIFLKYEPLTNV